MVKTRRTRPKPAPVKPPPSTNAVPVEPAYRKGEMAQHRQFGNGRIVHVEANKLTIAFDKSVGTKLVIESYVKPG